MVQQADIDRALAAFEERMLKRQAETERAVTERIERRILSGQLYFQHAQRHRAGGGDRVPGGSSLTVREIDGTPTIPDVNTIEFSNGSVTDMGGGVARVTTGGGGGGAPTNAQYLVLGADPTLTQERVFTPGTDLTAVDGGANSTYTLNHGAGSSATNHVTNGNAHDHLGGDGAPIPHNAVATSGIPSMKDWREWTATEMFGPLTNGVDTPEVAEEATNKVNWWGIPFDPNTQQYAALRVVRLPGNYDGGTVTFTLMWTATQSTGNVVWGVQAFAAADGDNIDTAWGTAQEVTDSLIGTSKVHVATTPALTIANTPAAGKYLYVRVYRKAADAADTLGAKAYLKHVTMEFSLSKLSKAV